MFRPDVGKGTMNKVTKVEREVLSIGRVLFESLLLVVSVVLGFVVSEWGTHRPLPP